MNRKNFATLATAFTLLGSFSLSAAVKGSSFGIVDFVTCAQDSKFGKQEQESFESLKNQMQSMLQDADRQLQDVAQKLNDPEYMDGLSPEGEKDLKMRYQALSEELQRYQGQYYQVLQQAYMKMGQSIDTRINTASNIIAKDYKIPLILKKEAVFFYDEKFDVTKLIIDRMNEEFESEQKIAATAGSKQEASTVAKIEGAPEAK